VSKRRILDAGSGHDPHPSANVLCDISIGSEFHRGGRSAVLDGRPFVVCDIQFLPFKNSVFYLVYSNHVLEHVGNPSRAIQEFKRVGKHGYVSFPSRLWELFFHREWAPHQWAVDPSAQAPISTQKGLVKTLKRITHLFWHRNFRIRLRERLFQRIFFSESVIRW